MEGVNAGLQQHPGDMDSSSGPAGGPPGGLLHNSGLLIGIGVALVAIFFSVSLFFFNGRFNPDWSSSFQKGFLELIFIYTFMFGKTTGSNFV